MSLFIKILKIAIKIEVLITESKMIALYFFVIFWIENTDVYVFFLKMCLELKKIYLTCLKIYMCFPQTS